MSYASSHNPTSAIGASAVLDAGGVSRTPGRVVQECGVGLVPVRMVDVETGGDALACAAPPLIRSGPVDDADVAIEVRAFFNDGGGPLREDPVTGNAAV